VNSTAGQQALWRGIPLKAFGTAVYSKPEFVSDLPLPAFFTAPERPDAKAYRTYRQFLLETSQVPGGFYSASGRQQLLRHLVDMMLQDADPYDALLPRQSHASPPLRVVQSGPLQ
jgi:capsular polysaccharide export protein